MAKQPYSTSFFDVMPTASHRMRAQSGKRWASLVAVALLIVITLNHALGMSFAPIALQGQQGRFCSPVKAHISSNYGVRMHPISHVRRKHDGIDFSVPYGQAVRAFTDGRVDYSGWMGGYGQAVQLNHGPIDKVSTSTRYAHLSRRAVAPGQWVKKGQIIGYSGSSGLSTGPHLHFEVIKNGSVTNPNPYLKQVVSPGQPNAFSMLATNTQTEPLKPVGASGPWFGRMVNFIDGPVAAPVPIEWRGFLFLAMLILLGIQCVRWELQHKKEQAQVFDAWQTLRAETNKTPLSQVLSSVSQSIPPNVFVPSPVTATSSVAGPSVRVKWTLPQAQNPMNNPFMTRPPLGT